MSKLSIKAKISRVLMENENGFLTISNIAEIAYEAAYMKETKNHLNGLIKRNIQHAIALLNDEGFLVIKDLKPCVNGNKMTHREVGGYKIADKEDLKSIEVNIITKNERLEIANERKNQFLGLAHENNLLENVNNTNILNNK